MAMHNTNSILKIAIPVVVAVLLLVIFLPKHGNNQANQENTRSALASKKIKNSASNDSAAESLDTLTASLAENKQQVAQVIKDNEDLKRQNAALLKKVQGTEEATTSSLTQEMEQLKNQIQHPLSNNYPINTATSSGPITTVPDLTQSNTKTANPFNIFSYNGNPIAPSSQQQANKPKIIPYYTIPSNSTAIHDKLMSALVGRIPIKGVVTDPYPFKIVFSDDTLAANGLRVPHLRQMIVSGYAEGDLNLVSVRGWVTSLTFVFDDGTISTTTSNNNDIGHFTKENALGYLSDPRGNPFISGKLITNAPTYLTGNVLLNASQGFAGAFAAEQTTSTNNPLGGSSTTVTGSPMKYALGQAGVNAANGVSQWWQEREENSFDAIYVPSGQEIVVNFAKEIQVDYNPLGRKIDYAKISNPNVSRHLD